MKQKMKQKHFKHFQGKPEWKYIKPLPEQKYVVDMRLEKACIAFLIGQDCNKNENLQKVLENRMQYNLSALQVHTECYIGMYFTASEVAVLGADVVSACATLGFKASDVLDVLLSMKNYDTNEPVVTVDDTQIWSTMYAPFGAVRAAVYYVINKQYMKD